MLASFAEGCRDAFELPSGILSTRTMMRMNSDEHENAEDDNGTCGIM